MTNVLIIYVPLLVFCGLAWVTVTVWFTAIGLQWIERQPWCLDMAGLVAGLLWIWLVCGISISLALMLLLYLSGGSRD